MWAPESASRLGVEMSALRSPESMTSVSGASWPPPGTASKAGGGMSAGVDCAWGGLVLAQLAAPVSVDRDTAGNGLGECTEDAL